MHYLYGGRLSKGGSRNSGRLKMQCQICAKTGHDAKVCYYRLNVMPTEPNQCRNPIIPPQSTSNFQNPRYFACVPPQMPQQWISSSKWHIPASGFIPRHVTTSSVSSKFRHKHKLSCKFSMVCRLRCHTSCYQLCRSLP